MLGPAGFKAVQISPPQEHSIVPSRDWSERYQPVSYSVARSRSGTGAEFADMVTRCNAAGVDIIVDAVINHMTNFPSPGVGSNGTAYTKYSYPGPLHVRLISIRRARSTTTSSAANVQDCELFSLPDLNTGSPSVRQKIADYLISLARLGVAGFRIDAAKHIQQVELDDIIAQRQHDAGRARARPLPYVFLEVVGGGTARRWLRATISARATARAAQPTSPSSRSPASATSSAAGTASTSRSSTPTAPPGNQFSELAWGLMPSDKAVVFLQNHDTQHECGLSYRDGDVFRLANVWMLAQPYGYPSILSSYAFDCPAGNSMGPPSDAAGNTKPCRARRVSRPRRMGQWVCEHRDPYIRAHGRLPPHRRRHGHQPLVGRRRPRDRVLTRRQGFRRHQQRDDTVTATVTSGLSQGSYCDRLSGGKIGTTCAGLTVVVGAGGTIQLNLAPGRRSPSTPEIDYEAAWRAIVGLALVACAKDIQSFEVVASTRPGVVARRGLLRDLRPLVLRQQRRRHRRPERADLEARLHQRRQPADASATWARPASG